MPERIQEIEKNRRMEKDRMMRSFFFSIPIWTLGTRTVDVMVSQIGPNVLPIITVTARF